MAGTIARHDVRALQRLASQLEACLTEGMAVTIAFDKIVRCSVSFSLEKAHEFYIDFLGCKVDFEHRFASDLPVYMRRIPRQPGAAPERAPWRWHAGLDRLCLYDRGRGIAPRVERQEISAQSAGSPAAGVGYARSGRGRSVQQSHCVWRALAKVAGVIGSGTHARTSRSRNRPPRLAARDGGRAFRRRSRRGGRTCAFRCRRISSRGWRAKPCAGLGRRAKYLLADLSSGEVLLMHLGMSGSFRVSLMTMTTRRPASFITSAARSPTTITSCSKCRPARP